MNCFPSLRNTLVASRRATAKKLTALHRIPAALLVVALGMLLAGAPARAALIVAPTGQTSAEGSQNNSAPFGQPNFRYQQVYGATDFSSQSSPQIISQIAFRSNGTQGAFTDILSSIQIDLSTTSKAVDGLSTTFASNVGANNLTVYSGALTLSSTSDHTGAGGTNPFDIVINLSNPFLYDPSAGNLLLDIRNFGTVSSSPLFDAQNTNGDSVSRILAPGASSTTETLADSLGLVTQFTVIPTPEPATWAMMAMGVCALAFLTWRNKREERGGQDFSVAA